MVNKKNKTRRDDAACERQLTCFRHLPQAVFKLRAARKKFTPLPVARLQLNNNKRGARAQLVINKQQLWTTMLHRKRYIPLAYRHISELTRSSFKRLRLKHPLSPLNVWITRKPGLLRIPLRALLWGIRRVKPKIYIPNMYVLLPRSHGFRKYKKVARRKRRLQKVNQARQRYAC